MTSSCEKGVQSSIGAPYRQELAERDALALTSLYSDRGMVNAVVTSRTRELAAPAGALALVFEVTEGEVFRVGKIGVSGFSLGAEKEVLKNFESKPRTLFSRSAVIRDMDRVRSRAQLQGHVVELTPLTTVGAQKKTIDVVFEIVKKPGGPMRF